MKMISTKGNGTKRQRTELEEESNDNPASKKQKLDGNKSKCGNESNLNCAEFKKALGDILKPELFICNSEGEDDWSVIDLPPSQVYKSMKTALKDGIGKIIDNNIDDITGNIISFCYVSDRILSCIEDQNDIIFGDDEKDNESWRWYDKLYAMIIKGGLDSNIKYSKYNELTFEWNKYLKAKEMIEDLYLYGGHVDIYRTSDEEDYDEEEKKKNSKKRQKLKKECNKIKDLILKYKKDGMLKKYSPYSVKIPDFDAIDPEECCDEFYQDAFGSDEENDEKILKGFGENGTDGNWNDGAGINYSNHYIVFEFKDDTKLAMKANIAWT